MLLQEERAGVKIAGSRWGDPRRHRGRSL